MRLQLLTLDHLVQLMDPKLYLHLQSADSTNFFFFFRMLLVWYKREFEWPDVLRLWESLWTDHLSSNFHIFVALAILEKHRDVIMNHLKHFDEVLKYGERRRRTTDRKGQPRLADTLRTVNDLSNTIDLQSTLIRAEALFRRFERTVQAIDKKSNFPSPSVRQRKPVAGPVLENGAASSSGTDASTTSQPASPADGKAKEKGKVISPELRALLSRKVQKLDKKAVVEHGGGVGNPRK